MTTEAEKPPFPRSNELWKHYKGEIYRIICFGFHTETREPMIVYTHSAHGDKVWIRPAEMFREKIILGDGNVVDRFKKVGYARKGEPDELFEAS